MRLVQKYPPLRMLGVGTFEQLSAYSDSPNQFVQTEEAAQMGSRTSQSQTNKKTSPIAMTQLADNSTWKTENLHWHVWHVCTCLRGEEKAKWRNGGMCWWAIRINADPACPPFSGKGPFYVWLSLSSLCPLFPGKNSKATFGRREPLHLTLSKFPAYPLALRDCPL